MMSFRIFYFCTAINGKKYNYNKILNVLHFSKNKSVNRLEFQTPGADAIKKFTPSLGIPYLGVRSWEPLVTPKSGLLNF